MKAIFRDDAGKFLVLKQSSKIGFHWTLPGGKPNYGENPFEALAREIREEMKCAIEIIGPAGIWWRFRPGNGDQVICMTFFCRIVQGGIDISGDPDKEILEFRWVTKSEFLSDEYPVVHESLKKLISEKL